MRTYELKPHQIRIYNELKSLPEKRLAYFVFQQSLTESNLTLNELKKIIRRAVRKFCYDNGGYNYSHKHEKKLVKYICFFEVAKDFFWSQHTNEIVDEDINCLGLHFHLFISFDSNINLPHYFSFTLAQELCSVKHKLKSWSKFDYDVLTKLNEDFIYYHTKQMMFRYEPRMILKNF